MLALLAVSSKRVWSMLLGIRSFRYVALNPLSHASVSFFKSPFINRKMNDLYPCMHLLMVQLSSKVNPLSFFLSLNSLNFSTEFLQEIFATLYTCQMPIHVQYPQY